jgi:hypothetical protein
MLTYADVCSAQDLPLAPLSDAAANDVMDILLSSDGNFVQDILLDEVRPVC